MSTPVEWSARWPFETRPRPPQTQCAPAASGARPRHSENGGEKLGHGSGGMELLRAA